MSLNFSTVKDAIPVAVTAYVLMGIIKALAFYYLFGIRIIDYIDFSESLLLFLDDLLIFATGLFFAVLTYVFYRNIPQSLLSAGIIIVILDSIYLYVLLRNYYHLSLYFSIIEAVGMLIVLSVAFYLIYNTSQRGYAMLCFLTLTFLVSIIEFRIKRDYDVIVKEEPEKETTCYLADSTVVRTGMDTVYVGRTKKNLFFYIKSTKTALIFKEEEIKRIAVRKLKDPQIKYAL